MSSPYSDEDLNEDWIKTLHWDLGFQTLPTLLAYLGVEQSPLADQQAAVVKFMSLPAWFSAPPQLILEVRDFLGVQIS